MTRVNFDTFLKRVAQSGLLNSQQLKQALALARREPDAERAAVALVNRDFLTRWQARQLLSPKPQRFFWGHYRLLKELGRGAMGTVYRAVHPKMNRVVALKVMSRDKLRDAKSIARFQREIRIAAALDHPQIVRAFDAGEQHGRYYLVMEHVDGKDVRHWIKTSGPLPVEWSCECIRQAALGLEHADRQGVAHRDLKPSNLLVCGKSIQWPPQVKIADFGLARVATESDEDMKLTQIGRTVGTFAYMSPEQTMDSSRADVRSDIFSLGCTLFEMVTGQLPFSGKSDLEMLMQRLHTAAPPLRTVRHDIPQAVEAIVARMLARQPEDRFQTPAELIAALQRVTTPTLDLNPPPPPPGPASWKLTAELSAETNPELDLFLQSMSSETCPAVKHLSSETGPQPHQRRRWRLLAALAAIGGLILLISWGWTLQG